MPNDTLDTLIEQWTQQRPDLDARAMGIVGRVLRLSLRFEASVEAALKPFDLALWQFDVLATLRRAAPPQGMSPSQLMAEVMLSSGAMTNRIDRLVAAGLVKRDADPQDRRGVRVSLTSKGRQLIDRAVAARFENAREAIAPLSPRECETMEKTLRKLINAAEA